MKTDCTKHFIFLSLALFSLPLLSALSVHAQNLDECIIPIDKLKTLITQADNSIAIVDIRKPEQFSSSHPPRALNLPAFAIRKNLQLKKSTIVLIGPPADDGATLEVCIQLRRDGFNPVFIASGGITGWKLADGELIGSAPAPAPQTIALSTFLRDLAFRKWLLLGDGREEKPACARNLEFHSTASSYSEVVTAITELRKRSLQPILLPGEFSPQLDRLRRELPPLLSLEVYSVNDTRMQILARLKQISSGTRNSGDNLSCR